MNNDKNQLEFDAEESNDSLLDYADARTYASGEITRYAVDMLDFYSEKMPSNQALSMVIEALSVSLGNLISLVKEDNQQEVIEDAKHVIQMGLVAQTELIAEMAYGQIGHS